VSAAVVACCDAPPVFEFGEHIFDLVALFIEDGVIGNEKFPVLFGRDAGSDALGLERRPEPVGSIAPVGQQCFGGQQGIKQSRCTLVITHLALRQQQGNGLAAAVADGMEFRVQAAFRAPDTTGNSPFLLQGSGGAVRFPVCGVDHQTLRHPGFSGQCRENPVEYPSLAPAHKAVVQRLVRAVLARGIFPWQAVADDLNDAADNAQVIHAGDTVRQRKIRCNPLKL
jgi:hypothetical protein